jgi:hypothetical protein
MNATKTALIPVLGDTYPVKDQLKAIGARWNADRKCWMIPVEKSAEASRIVNAVRKSPASVPARKFARPSFGGLWTCGVCGEENKASAGSCWECGCNRR